MRTDDMPLNVISHNAAMSACEKRGQWEHTFDLLPKMRCGSTLAHVISSSSAISKSEPSKSPSQTPIQWSLMLLEVAD